MSRSLTPPSAGQPISALFFAELLREVRANRPLQGRNTRLKRTPNGTHISAVATASSVAKHLPGCFEYAGTVDKDGNKFYGRPYFMIGSRLYRALDEDVKCGSTKGVDFLNVTLDKGELQAKVGHVQDYAELQEKADDKDLAIIPLYELGENGSPVADLRTMPLISSWEFST